MNNIIMRAKNCTISKRMGYSVTTVFTVLWSVFCFSVIPGLIMSCTQEVNCPTPATCAREGIVEHFCTDNGNLCLYLGIADTSEFCVVIDTAATVNVFAVIEGNWTELPYVDISVVPKVNGIPLVHAVRDRQMICLYGCQGADYLIVVTR